MYKLYPKKLSSNEESLNIWNLTLKCNYETLEYYIKKTHTILCPNLYFALILSCFFNEKELNFDKTMDILDKYCFKIMFNNYKQIIPIYGKQSNYISGFSYSNNILIKTGIKINEINDNFFNQVEKLIRKNIIYTTLTIDMLEYIRNKLTKKFKISNISTYKSNDYKFHTSTNLLLKYNSKNNKNEYIPKRTIITTYDPDKFSYNMFSNKLVRKRKYEEIKPPINGLYD